MLQLQDNIENNFKAAPLYKQLQREIKTLKSTNQLNEIALQNIKKVREKQAEQLLQQQERIKELEKDCIKNNIDTPKEETFTKEHCIIFSLSQLDNEELEQIELFNRFFKRFGIELTHKESRNYNNLIINYNTKN